MLTKSVMLHRSDGEEEGVIHAFDHMTFVELTETFAAAVRPPYSVRMKT
jgi:hypothetical protein